MGNAGVAKPSLAQNPSSIQQENVIKLWNSGTCPYAARAWVALLEKELQFETVLVDLQNKSEDFVLKYGTVNPELHPRAKVPIIEDGDFVMIESDVCVYYLEEAYPSFGHRLLPAAATDRAIVRLFCTLYNDLLGSLQFKFLKALDDPAALESLTPSLTSGIIAINKFLTTHGNPAGPFVLGEAFSVAEVITGPFVQRLLPVLRHFCNIDVLDIARTNQCERFVSWVEATVARPSIRAQIVPEDQLIANYKLLIERMKNAA